MKTSRPTCVDIIDDDPDMQTLLQEFFAAAGYRTRVFGSAEDGLKAIQAEPGDLLICDLSLPDISGLEVIGRLKDAGSEEPVILITAHATMETAADALSRGAFDYVTKPVNLTELKVICSRAIHLRRLERQYRELQSRVRAGGSASTGFNGLLGQSAAMRRVFDLVTRVSQASSNVMVNGESGTGKEMVARAIHENSARQAEAFVAINCAAIPENLLESELFGHKKGSFTGANENRRGLFEEANGGTIFLDEIGDLALHLQAKILRVLQDRKVRPIGENQDRQVDVRVICATHRDIKNMIAEGKFREDLYYRLCVIPIQLPPLRDRKEDIPLLAAHFLKKYAEQSKTKEKTLSPAAADRLLRMPWHGNVRELENTMERAAVLSVGMAISPDEIQLIDAAAEPAAASSPANANGLPPFNELMSLAELEKRYIRYVLAETGNRKERASEILGINRKTLYRKQIEYGLNAEGETEPAGAGAEE